MDILRWILGLAALAIYLVCVVALIQFGIRRLRTGQYASGLSFVPSVVGAMGILILPLSTIGIRALFVAIPFAIESMYFWFNMAYDFFDRRVA